MGTVKRFRIKSFKKQKPVVSLNNVSLSFGDRNILKNISFNIEPGIYGLLGPNGSGKSTLFNLITGNLKPDSGSIHFGETIATDIPIYLRTRMFNIGFVPQIGGIFHSLTLLDNLKCIGEILIKDKREIIKITFKSIYHLIIILITGASFFFINNFNHFIYRRSS